MRISKLATRLALTLSAGVVLSLSFSQAAFAECTAVDGKNCAQAAIVKTAAPTAKKPAERASAELTAVKTAIGKATCETNDQCQAVAMGAKACGGPEFFLAWSSAVQNDKRVKAENAPNIPQLAQKHRAAREAQIAAEGEMSDCKVVSDPGAQCVAKKCVLKPAAKAGVTAS